MLVKSRLDFPNSATSSAVSAGITVIRYGSVVFTRGLSFDKSSTEFNSFTVIRYGSLCIKALRAGSTHSPKL